MKRAIVSGAAGFTGAVLCEQLRKQNIEVIALLRPGSEHNSRLSPSDPGLQRVELAPENYGKLPEILEEESDVFFHLLQTGKNELLFQNKNAEYSLLAIEAAKACGCRRIVYTGSQAELGLVPMHELSGEDRPERPFSAYGAAKTAALHLTKIRAKELEMEWVWGRIFSLIGKYEPKGRMLPDLFHALKAGKSMRLSSCRQNWDYLDVHDGADALIALAEAGKSGEIYNIAHGNYRPLREFTERLKAMVSPSAVIEYGEDPNPFVSLQPTVEKLKRDTGWRPKRSFENSVRDYEEYDKDAVGSD